MNATPCRSFPDFCFMGWRMPLEALTVVRQLRDIVGFNVMQRVSECHLTLFVMVAVGFTVGCRVNNLRPGPRRRKRSLKAPCEALSLFQQALERDRWRNR